MIAIKKLVLDVLKPHSPSILELARSLAELGEGYRVHLDVEEMDEKTETVVIVIEGNNLDFEAIDETIKTMGGSLHSVDQVVAENLVESP